MRLAKIRHRESLNELNFRDMSPKLAKAVRTALLLGKFLVWYGRVLERPCREKKVPEFWGYWRLTGVNAVWKCPSCKNKWVQPLSCFYPCPQTLTKKIPGRKG